EFWPPGETGSKSTPRPTSIPLNSPGITVYSDKVRPIDILGDTVSHYLVNTNPTYQKFYKDFADSVTPQQEKMLKDQYNWAIVHEGEKRPYAEWRKVSGLPAYFRGYAFKQWPDEFNQKNYTPGQRKLLDQMIQDLSQPVESQTEKK
ncbi:MAG: hypothetical protein KGL39_48575, partial [Patescibacteria group bacterium]|nr:hypothetical protein [Patescibacteria group bacterium]